MQRLLWLLVTFAAGLAHSRRDLLFENLALRQQLAALTQQKTRPRLANPDRIFWIVLRWFWSGWRGALVIVQPDTVTRRPDGPRQLQSRRQIHFPTKARRLASALRPRCLIRHRSQLPARREMICAREHNFSCCVISLAELGSQPEPTSQRRTSSAAPFCALDG